MKKKLIGSLLSVGLISSLFVGNSAQAYDLFTTSECPKVPYPKNIYYWVDGTFQNYSGKWTEVVESVNKWDALPEVEFTTRASLPGGADVKVEFGNFYNGDLYGKYFLGSKGNTIIYKKWFELSATREREVIVHEVGHALGLGHTQTKNDPNAVMRQYGFNDKDYPLSDDKAGIAARY
ncbi:matrixin family metalloprotease [Cytobacillus oceanisediminis]|uniref:matrixin family metalloprotease n=1 Tax=Cytobacillus oceanisediminis TaxID=665099 RepID=UPI001FB3055A|nr:matrixin family metalloprotease [Cytobacillus oceanisediminis]UOE58009.1 matrixin family metalloprotease [Cytobacillus oceanisediminis]